MCLCSATGCAFSLPARMKCYPQCECLLRSPSLCNAERPFSLLHCRHCCCRVLSWPLVQSRWSDEWERGRGQRGRRGASPDRELLLLLCVMMSVAGDYEDRLCVSVCEEREQKGRDRTCHAEISPVAVKFKPPCLLTPWATAALPLQHTNTLGRKCTRIPDGAIWLTSLWESMTIRREIVSGGVRGERKCRCFFKVLVAQIN